jgi:hypothetical protein
MMSQATIIIKEQQEARDQILVLCGFTEDRINELQWEGAIECLKKVLRSDEYGIYELPKSADFWLWWRDQWYRRDEQFLTSLKWDFDIDAYSCKLPDQDTWMYLCSAADFGQMYLRYHRMTADNPLVNNNLMEASFHRMIKDIVRHK